MKKHPSPGEWVEEYKQFISTQEVMPPSHLTDAVFHHVRSGLNPSAWFLFAKLALIHLIVGTLTLLFCPQFGIQLGGGRGLMGYLMRFGDQVCMFGCGVEFIIGTAIVAALFLRPEEVRILRKTKVLQFSALALLSIGAFVCLGEGVIFTLALFWLFGMMAGGLTTLELGWLVRAHLFGKA